MKLFVSLLLLFIAVSGHANDLVDDAVLKAFSQELSGEVAKRNLEFLSRQHRMRGSRGFKNAAEFLAGDLRSYGIQDVEIAEFPADGKTFYGTQRSRRPWDADFAELWEIKEGSRIARLASWEAQPLSLAQDSESGEVTTTLVDIGEGASDNDYTGKDVKGKIVLVSRQPEDVVPFAIDKYGASGILSYAQNQITAWWGEDTNLLRWGHAGTFNKKPVFAFMITPNQAELLRKRLAAGEQIQLHAKVDAGQHNGSYQVLTAVIPGSDPALRDQEIVFSCHLDHPRPGANDNASGCVTILEIARSYTKLIQAKKITWPARTLRFIWPPEIEGTMVFLTARPEIRKRILTAIHLDMVGGGPVTKAQFHVTRGPASLPSFIYDVVNHFAKFVNDQTLQFAESGTADYPLVAMEGGKEPLQAILSPFSMGSDHVVYSDGSFEIPSAYFNDWPDRYIHTNFDVPANIDPTKLKRAGFLGAISAHFLSNLKDVNAKSLTAVLRAASLSRASETLKKRSMDPDNADSIGRFFFWHEQKLLDSLHHYSALNDHTRNEAASFLKELSEILQHSAQPALKGTVVYERNAELRGPMGVFGYDYLEAHYGLEKTRALKLHGNVHGYEALNFVDGQRSVEEITDLLSGAYGTVALKDVREYLSALESIQVLRKK